jgi:hypothetical protein
MITILAKRSSLLALTIALITPGLKAQLPAGSEGSFNPALLQLFGQNRTFTGRTELRVTDTGNKEVMRMPMTMACLDTKVRVEVNLAELNSSKMPAQAAAMFKQAGMEQVASILRPDRKQAIISFPTAKIYTQEAMSASDLDGFTARYDIRSEDIGRETLEGHPCMKSKVTVQSSSGGTMQGTVWRATDLKNFPIRIILPSGDSTVEMTFKDLKLAKPDPTLFEAPVGHRRYDNMEKLMTERMASLIGGAPPAK